MSDQNPYSTPDAALATGSSDTYDPSIFSFRGRIGRLRYLAYNVGLNLVMSVVMVPIMGVSAFTGGDMAAMGGVSMILLGILYTLSLVITIMYGKRRLNDLNRSGWFMLLLIIPLINLFLIIYMLFFRGTEGDNNYGSEAVPNTIGVKILGIGGIIIFALSFVGIVAAIIIPALA